MNKFKKNILIWLVIGFLLASFYNSFIGINKNTQIQDIAFSEFLQELDKGNVVDVNIKGDSINGNLIDGKKLNARSENDEVLAKDTKVVITNIIDEIAYVVEFNI